VDPALPAVLADPVAWEDLSGLAAQVSLSDREGLVSLVVPENLVAQGRLQVLEVLGYTAAPAVQVERC